MRLATQPYTTNKKTLKKTFIHLTNYSINKKASDYKKNMQSGDGNDGEEDVHNNENANDENGVSSKWSF